MKETVTKSSKKLLAIFLSVLMVLSSLPLASLAVFAAPEDNTVDEYVVTITHGSDIVENAEVKIGEQTETTNSEGKATFTDLPYADSVKMTVTATGYKTAEVTLVINEMTTFTSYDMQKVFTVSGRAVSNVGATLENLSVTATDGDKNATVTVNGTNFSFTATEGNDITYVVSAKNHNSVSNTFTIDGNKNLGDVTLNAKIQRVTISINESGKVEIDDTELSGNTVDILFTNGSYKFKAIANKDDGYHIKKITGAVSYNNPGNNNQKINSHTEYETTVELGDNPSDTAIINVEFELNSYDVTINANKNYVLSVDGTEYDTNRESQTYNKTFTHGYNALVTVFAKGTNSIATITIGDKTYGESSDPPLSDLFNENTEKYELTKTIDNSISISATTRGLNNTPVDISNISITTPVFKEGNTYYYNDSVVVKNLNYTASFRHNIGYKDVVGTEPHTATNELKFNSSTVVAEFIVKQNRLGDFHPVTGTDINFVIDKTKPTVTARANPGDWTNNDKVTVSGSVTDEGGSGIDYIVYSTEKLTSLTAIEDALKPTTTTIDEEVVTIPAKAQIIDDADISSDKTSATFSFDLSEEQDQTYYIYAVDRVGNINANANNTVDVKIDRTEPYVTNIDYYLDGQEIVFSEKDKLSDTLYGRTSDKDFEVEVEVRDIFVNDASSRAKGVNLYAEDEDGIRPLSISPISNSSNDLTDDGNKYNKAVYRFKITAENAQKWTQIKAEAIDNAGNKSAITDKKEATLNGIKFAILISNVEPKIAISETTEKDYSEKTTSDNYSVVDNETRYNNWYLDRTVSFKVNIDDNCPDGAHTGLKSVKISINNRTINNTVYSKSDKTEDVFNISTQDTIVDDTDSDNGKSLLDAAALNEGINTIKVEAINNNGRTTVKEYYFYRDTEHPKFTKAEFVKADDSAIDNIVKLFTFGIFKNDDVYLKLTAIDFAEDATNQSKLKSFELYDGDELKDKVTFDADKRKNKDDHTFTIKMGNGYIGNLYVKVTDSVGNVNYIDVNDETAGTGKKALETVPSTEIKSHYIVLENTPPTINSSSLDEPDNADANTETVVRDEKGDATKWYAGDINLRVEYYDSGIYSGLYESSLTLNGEYIIQNDKEVVSHRIYHEKASGNDEKYEDIVSESSFLINTENANNDDGSYNLKATVRDNAGNKGEDYEETFYIDRDAPYITNFDFVGDYQEIVDGKQKLDKDGKDAKVNNYGYYFNSPTTVTITASDDKGPSSGVREITLRFIDFNGKKVNEITRPVDVNNQCSFEIAKDFKGVIIACATDNVWHQGYFYTPDGVIYETNEPKIEFLTPTYKENGNKTKVQAPYRLNKAKDSDDEKNTKYKNELFNADAYLPFDITDSASKDSGIREISWEITTRSGIDNKTKGYKTILLSKGVRKVDNAGKLIKENPTNNGKSKLYGEMKIDENNEYKTENNLVHHITGKFLIADDYNDIIVKLKVTDRAGNFKEESKVLSVDKTDPKIKLEFTDNNKKTGQFAGYYNKDREAVITVKERNFDPTKKENLNFIIKNIDESYSSTPDIEKAIRQIKNWSCSWKTKENKEHGYNIATPDDSTYIYKFKFKVDKKDNGDGNYDLNFSLKDMVGNKSNHAKSTFILDGTAPSITVKFSEKGQSKKNPNYYNEDVTITVTITEHFITPKECDKLFKNLIALQNNGDKKKKYKQPKFTSFKKTGKDKFEATAVLKDNAKHSINMSIEDKAGNKFTLFEKKTNKDKAAEINVDHNKPEIKFLNDIEGLDKAKFASYNKEQFTPVITITDEDGNLDTAIDSKSYVIRISGTRHQNESYDYFAGNSEEVDVKTVKDKDGNVKECTFTIKTFNPKTFKRDDVYVMNVIAVDKAGNEINSGAQYFSINRYGSTYDYNLMSTNRNTEGSIFEDTLYTVPFVSKSNPITLFTEYNCDNIKEKKTQLKLVYTNTKQQTEKEMELVQGFHYKIVPALDNKKVFHTKAYSYQLVDEELFNEDGVYEIYAKTKDAAKNTNKNNVAVEKNDRTKKIIKFVVDNTAPRIDAKQSFEKIAYIDNDIYQIDTKSNKSTLKDDLFETDGKSCAFNIAIDEENLGLDAIDINDLKITIDKNPVNFEILSENKENVVNKVYEENGVYNAMIKIDAPADYSVNLVISLRDRAGNERIWKADELLISNNWFIRFIHNPLAVGITIGVIVLIAVGIALFIILKRRKERDDEE